jgi:hypothetical protein
MGFLASDRLTPDAKLLFLQVKNLLDDDILHCLLGVLSFYACKHRQSGALFLTNTSRKKIDTVSDKHS